MSRFMVTYEIVTPESAEDGEAAEHGYAIPGGWRDPIDIALEQPDDTYAMGLRAALDLCGGPFIDCGRWFAVADAQENYQTGESTSYSLHPPSSITNASYKRLARLLASV